MRPEVGGDRLFGWSVNPVKPCRKGKRPDGVVVFALIDGEPIIESRGLGLAKNTGEFSGGIRESEFVGAANGEIQANGRRHAPQSAARFRQHPSVVPGQSWA